MMMQEQFEPGGSRLEQRGNRRPEGVARLAPGVSRERAQAEMTVVAARIAAENDRERFRAAAEAVLPLLGP